MKTDTSHEDRNTWIAIGILIASRVTFFASVIAFVAGQHDLAIYSLIVSFYCDWSSHNIMRQYEHRHEGGGI